MLDTDLTELALGLLFFAAVIFGGLLLLYLVNLVISAIGEVVER